MSTHLKIKKILAASMIIFAGSLPLGQAQAASAECNSAQAVVSVLLVVYRAECIRGQNIVCSNARLTFHFNRITSARIRAARLCI
jgi:hypothetical protein